MDPFSLTFSPADHAAQKSHFQLTFLFVPSHQRRQALADLYAFCRLADDIADQPDLEISFRKSRIAQLRGWVLAKEAVGHPFWDRFLKERNRYQIDDQSLLGVLDGVLKDIEQRTFKTWTELDEYVYGVACCVGEAVLCIVGANEGTSAKNYAYEMGRCLQYLNIMRDLEEDHANGRLYVPQEFMHSLDSQLDENERLQKIRDELYRRALLFKASARPYSLRCVIAELMAGLYLEASKSYWRWGNPRRLSKAEKIYFSLKTLVQFIFRRPISFSI